MGTLRPKYIQYYMGTWSLGAPAKNLQVQNAHESRRILDPHVPGPPKICRIMAF